MALWPHYKSCNTTISRVSQIRRLALTCWGAGATTLHTTTLVLVHSTAVYCTPAWCYSSHTHLIDPIINNTLGIVIECLYPTPMEYLSVLASISAAELYFQEVLVSFAC